MELCEYQNKRLLRENKIPVLSGEVAYTVEESVEKAEKIGAKSWRLHVQVPKGEKILKYIPAIKGSLDAHSLKDVEKIALDLFRTKVITASKREYLVQRIYVEELCQIEKRLSFSMRVDTQRQKMIFSFNKQKNICKNGYFIQKTPSGAEKCRLRAIFCLI